jgi:phage gp36-like protein
MAYATQSDLIARFGIDELLQLTDREGTGAVDGAVVGARLADAASLIDGYLAGRYAVPVSPPPALLVTMQADITRYQLHGNAATPEIRQAYVDALNVLKDISAGRAVLIGAAPVNASDVPAAAPPQVRVLAPPRIMDGCRLADYLG